MIAILFLLKPDRLEAYPTFAMVGKTSVSISRLASCSWPYNTTTSPGSMVSPGPGIPGNHASLRRIASTITPRSHGRDSLSFFPTSGFAGSIKYSETT